MSVKSQIQEAILDKALDAAKKINKLMEDPHPGLFTWNEASAAAHANFKAVLDEYFDTGRRPIDEAPRDGTRILAWDLGDDVPYICWWTDDVYKEQNGSGGGCGWFSGRYRDRWGDSPEMEHPVSFRLTNTL